MQLAASLISAEVWWGSVTVMALLTGVAIYHAPWKSVLGVGHRQHALFAAIGLLSLMWSLRFEVIADVHFHLFLMSTITLVFGWSLAQIIGAVAITLVAVFGVGEARALGVDWFFSVCVPSTTCYGLLMLVNRLRTRNLFVYLLGLGFFGTFVTTLSACLAFALFFALVQPSSVVQQLWDNMVFALPLLYAEAFINGVLVTSITVYWPDLVKTFDDIRFLKGRPYE